MRRTIAAMICAVVLVGVNITFVEAVNPNGRYSANGAWVLKKGARTEKGTHAGAFKLKGTRVAGTSNSSDGCTARYRFKLSQRPKNRKGMLKLTGSIVVTCPQKTIYKVTKGILSYKVTRIKTIKYKIKLVAKGTRGTNKGAVLAATAKGAKN